MADGTAHPGPAPPGGEPPPGPLTASRRALDRRVDLAARGMHTVPVSQLDRAWALSEIEAFQAAARSQDGSGADQVTMRERLHVLELLLDRVVPEWRGPGPKFVGGYGKYVYWSNRAKAALLRADELRAKLGDGAPEMDAGKLHPWVWEAAAPLWRTGHHAVSVTQAAVRVNAETQSKVGRRDVSETDLFNQVFSTEPPKPGAPRLRLAEDDGGKTYQSVHRGARALAEGLYAGVRNPAAHDVNADVDEQVALEQLAAFSLLARWVDAAAVQLA